MAIALGSNLGDRARHLDAAVGRLHALLGGLRVSRYHDTAPVGVGPQPRFLNAAATGTVTQTARALLDALLAVERDDGRERPYPGAARTLDLDIVFYGDARICEPGLEVPHPRFRHRAFVLDPLVEIAGDWVDPVTGLSVSELRARLGPAR